MDDKKYQLQMNRWWLNDAKKSVCQGWTVDWAPTDLKRSNEWQCSQHTSTDQTPIPCVPVTSPALKPKGRAWRAGTPALASRTGLTWAAKPIKAATPGLGTSVCYPPKKTSQCFGAAGSTRPGWMPPQVQVSNRWMYGLQIIRRTVRAVVWVKSAEKRMQWPLPSQLERPKRKKLTRLCLLLCDIL